MERAQASRMDPLGEAVRLDDRGWSQPRRSPPDRATLPAGRGRAGTVPVRGERGPAAPQGGLAHPRCERLEAARRTEAGAGRDCDGEGERLVRPAIGSEGGTSL